MHPISKKKGKKAKRKAIQNTFDFSRDQSRCKGQRRKGKTIGTGKKPAVFCGHEREKRKRGERVRARDVGEKARRGEILDTPKPVASPSINSTRWEGNSSLKPSYRRKGASL